MSQEPNVRWYVPWRVLHWLNDRSIWCWADLVCWKVFGSEWPGRNVRCASVAKSDGSLTCYCGFWDEQNPTDWTDKVPAEPAA